MYKKLTLVLLIACLFMQVVSANESMTMDDIMNTKPSIPFGGPFWTFLMEALKWGAIFVFLASCIIIMASGSAANAMNNANMKQQTQDAIFGIAKTVVFGAVIILIGTYIFKTFI